MRKGEQRRKLKYPILVIAIALAFIAVALISTLTIQRSTNSPYLGDTPGSNTLTLYFVNTTHPDYQRNCGAVLPVQRKVTQSTPVTPDQAIRILLSGTSEEEETRGFTSEFFQPGSWKFDEFLPLGDYFKKITVDQGMATVDFDSGALAYLNAAACIQSSVKQPIYWTLLQFPEISDVQFSFDGVVMTEFDA